MTRLLLPCAVDPETPFVYPDELDCDPFGWVPPYLAPGEDGGSYVGRVMTFAGADRAAQYLVVGWDSDRKVWNMGKVTE